jgi:GT2 family glycosyltransferase
MSVRMRTSPEPLTEVAGLAYARRPEDAARPIHAALPLPHPPSNGRIARAGRRLQHLFCAARCIARWVVAGEVGPRLRSALRLRRAARQVAVSALFDRGWYLRHYPDVAAAAVSPALHYVARGAAEGRNPGPRFDSDWYMAAHPEVAIASENPLVHYLAAGQLRGLAIVPAAPRLPRLGLTDTNYRAWIRTYDTLGHADEITIRAAIATMPVRPSFALAFGETSPAAIASVQAQLYPHWRVLDPLAAQRPAAEGEPAEFVLTVPPGVLLARTALFEFAASLASHPDTDLIYADEDCIDARGQRHTPWFKPDFDPELMLGSDPARNIAGRLALRRRGTGDRIDPARIQHVPAVLFHVRDNARIEPAPISTPIMPAAPSAEAPLVSIIVPTRDRAGLLQRCADGVLNRTAYPHLELIIADNDSREQRTRRLLARLGADPRVRVLAAPGAFNWSAINNRAVEAARGEVLVLLNNDIEVIDPNWLQAIVSLLRQPGVGIVGAKLVYPNGTIQHAGIVLGPAGAASHLWRGAPSNEKGYHGDLLYPRSVTAVTGACLAIHRSLYREAGGLDAEHLMVAYNDVDLCLRVRALGYRVVWTPDAVLLHREAASRGEDETAARRARAGAERATMVRRWGAAVDRDPALNPNLVVVRDRLALASPPARPRPWD